MQMISITIGNPFNQELSYYNCGPSISFRLPNAGFNENWDHATRLHLPRPMARNPQHRPDHTVMHSHTDD